MFYGFVNRKLACPFGGLYITPMNHNPPFLEAYPWRKIAPRWILGSAEMGLSVYIVMRFSQNLGLFLAAWWVISLFVLLPLLRCTKCHYFGKRCNTAWGLLADFAFKKGDPKYFSSGYALTVPIWLSRALPLGLGLLDLLDGLTFVPDGLFGIYVATIVIHRLYYRRSNCPVCFQKEVCPVYDPFVLERPQHFDSPADNPIN